MKNYGLILFCVLNTCLLFAQTPNDALIFKSELKAKMISEPATNFVLQNLEGEEISLESLKGKVVVLDFWATWCPPCKASFPMMQKAQERFKEDENVVFYFVNTREKGEDKVAKAKSFLEKKGYDFKVLFDLDQAVYKSYKMRGIPTKFVIDPAGNIRFKSVGYRGGNDEKLIEELAQMIELARAE